MSRGAWWVPLSVPWWDSPAQPGLGLERGRTPNLWEEATRSLCTPPGVTPQPPAAATSCPGDVAKGLLSPGSSGQVLEVRAGKAAGAGITAGRKCGSVSPANVLIPFNSPAAPRPWTRPRGHQPSPRSQGSSQPPSLEPFGRKASKGAQNVGKEHLEALLPSVVLSAQLSRQQPCQAAGASLPGAAVPLPGLGIHPEGLRVGFRVPRAAGWQLGAGADVRAGGAGQVPGRRQILFPDSPGLPGLVPAQLSLPGGHWGALSHCGVRVWGGRGTVTHGQGLWHPKTSPPCRRGGSGCLVSPHTQRGHKKLPQLGLRAGLGPARLI